MSLTTETAAEPAMTDSVASSPDSTQWLTEKLATDCQMQLASRQLLATETSPFQRIEVHETVSFGRVLRIDDVLMTSQRDEWFYHEPMIHVPLQILGADQESPLSVLVIGGGDGGSARELCRYAHVRTTVVEIDEAVVRLSGQWLPEIASGAFEDERVSLIIADGLQWLADNAEEAETTKEAGSAENGQLFDAIILDLTDPHGVAEALYTPEFYRLCQRNLTADGVISLHIGSPVMQPQRYRHMLEKLRGIFPTVQAHHHYVPVYGTLWGLAVATSRTLLAPAGQVPAGLKYYTHLQHSAWLASADWAQHLAGMANPADE